MSKFIIGIDSMGPEYLPRQWEPGIEIRSRAEQGTVDDGLEVILVRIFISEAR
jgi:hypothetical protein